MKKADQYLIRRRSTYHLQLSVPTHLRALVGKQLIVRSLKTTDPKLARRRRDEMLVEIRRTFAELEKKLPEEWSVVEFARKLRAGVQLGTVEPANARALLQDRIHETALREGDPHEIEGAEGEAVLRALDVLEAAEQGLNLTEGMERHLDALGGHARVQTVNARRRRLEDLAKHLKDPPLTAIRRRHLADYVTKVLGPDLRAIKTKKDTISDIAAAFTWFLNAGMIETHPAQGLTALVKESSRGVERPKRRAWSDAELLKLRGHLDGLKAGDYMPLLVKVGMFSGMRLNEICALRGKDIETDSSGELVFVVREAKNQNSLRKVPIHPQLVEDTRDLDPDQFLIRGLKAAGEDAKRGHEASKRFGRLKTAWKFGPELVFHGLRMSFITKLESAGVPVNVAESIVGHARQSMSYGVYSAGADLEVLREAVERVRYE